MKLDVSTDSTKNYVTLNYSHRPQEEQKNKLTASNSLHKKLKVLYITENVTGQHQTNNLVENASVFDFWDSYTILPFNQETALFHCFTFSLFSHCKNVKKNVWKSYKVEMMYDAKINCLRKKLLLKSSRIYGQFLLKCKND